MQTLKINQQNVSVDVAPDTPLLWVLRDQLGMTGTKFGCGQALCGACTVHVDGQATRSCVLPVSSVQGFKTIQWARPYKRRGLSTMWLNVATANRDKS